MTAVVRPRSIDELSSFVRDCATGARVRGAATTGLAPTGGALDLRLDALTGVVEYRPDDLIVTVHAGTRLDELEAELREQRQRLPVAPWPGKTGTIGGAIAACADGLVGARGMRLRDVLLGASAVLGNGDVVRVGARVVKSVSGFDVTRALVGSRGVLAAIAQVTLRVEALPAATVELRATCIDAHAAAAACAAALRDPLEPRGLAVRHDVDTDRFVVAAELAGPPRAVAAAEQRLAAAGFAAPDAAGLLAGWTAELARAPYRRVVTCSRVTPTESLGASPCAMADVRRGVTWIAGSTAHDEQPAALWTALRTAFDPGDTFRPGRGLAAC